MQFLEGGVCPKCPILDPPLHKLEAIQRCTTRFVMSDYHRTSSVSAMINSLNWQSISRQHEELHLIMFFKIVELPLPDYITLAPRVMTGDSIKFLMPLITVNPYKFSFFPRSISKWNKLPPCDCSVDCFKIMLKSMTEIIQLHPLMRFTFNLIM